MLHQSLDSKTVQLEACKAQISELEQIVTRSEESASKQKRLLSEVAEEYEEKLKVALWSGVVELPR